MSANGEPRHPGRPVEALRPAPVDRGAACATGPRACDGALAGAFGFLGKRWNGIILGTLKNGPAGFAVLSRTVGGISDSVLSDRLGELTSVGLVQRVVHDGPPVTVTYELTSSGQALMPALDGLAGWAHEHLGPGRA